MDAGYAEAEGGELGSLIVHEGDQWADNEGSASTGDGGELVAEGFSCSGGHDEEDVATVGGGSADGFLIGAERVEAEGLVKQGGKLHGLAQFRILFALGVVIVFKRCPFENNQTYSPAILAHGGC